MQLDEIRYSVNSLLNLMLKFSGTLILGPRFD